jgi:hypothetical protein
MANFKAFNGTEELNRFIVPVAQFNAMFPGVKGLNAGWHGDKYVGRTADGRLLPVERLIAYKQFPSRHECNAKCLNGKHNGTCECQCGGKNHGAGMFTRMLEAA